MPRLYHKKIVGNKADPTSAPHSELPSSLGAALFTRSCPLHHNLPSEPAADLRALKSCLPVPRVAIDAPVPPLLGDLSIGTLSSNGRLDLCQAVPADVEVLAAAVHALLNATPLLVPHRLHGLEAAVVAVDVVRGVAVQPRMHAISRWRGCSGGALGSCTNSTVLTGKSLRC